MLILLMAKGKEGEVETGTRVTQPQQVVASSFPSWAQKLSRNDAGCFLDKSSDAENILITE